MKINDFLNIRWEDNGLPLIEPGWNSPILADPSFLFPFETPDNKWVLFAHNVWGIHRYESEDGLVWKDRGMVIRNAMRPFCRFIKGSYMLYFEKYRPFAVVAQILPRPPKWKSRLALLVSDNLIRWIPSGLLIPDEPIWAVDSKMGKSISNPCIVQDIREKSAEWKLEAHAAPGAYSLYFSASLSYVPDCGFSEPRYIGVAHSPSPDGPFAVFPRPVIDPKDDILPGVLGAGSIKVLAMEDGFIGLQNKIYRDGRGDSRSALFVMKSEDGLNWNPAMEAPLISPTNGWRASHVYACDCREERNGTWYLYYNARDNWYKARGKERIGRIVGRL